MSTQRFVLAFLVAPFSPIAFLILVAAIEGSASSWGAGVSLLIMFGYFPCLLVGALLVLTLDALNKLTLPYLLLFGGLLGVLLMICISILFSLALGSKWKMDYFISNFIWGGSLGLVISLVFGLIAGVPLKNKK